MNVSRWNELAEQHGFIVVIRMGAARFLMPSLLARMSGLAAG
jgi:poly(3-hydroxybutyrate) depolymerase